MSKSTVQVAEIQKISTSNLSFDLINQRDYIFHPEEDFSM
jgi:hypothetical protein